MRQIRDDQGKNLLSKGFKSFCHKEGTEIVLSPEQRVEMNEQWQSDELSTYLRSRRKIGILRENAQKSPRSSNFFKNATLKLTIFKARKGREANTVLRNFTKKPSLRNLSLARVTRSKYACLDERDPDAQQMPHPADKK